MKAEPRKKIVLVDDHVIIREGLKELIEKIGPYSVVGEYDDGKAFINDLETVKGSDLVLMDVTMPEMDGDEVLDHLNSIGLKLPILYLTLNTDEKRLIQLFHKGARGCLLKNCTGKMLKNALDAVLNYGYYHNDLLEMALKEPSRKEPHNVILDQLKHREKEFLKLICNPCEYTYEQIADIMNVQFRTVDGYRESIFRKFAIKSKAGLVLFVLNNDLIKYM